MSLIIQIVAFLFCFLIIASGTGWIFPTILSILVFILGWFGWFDYPRNNKNKH